MPDLPVESEVGTAAEPFGVVLSSTATFPCGACGGQGAWHAGRQEVVCASCGSAAALPPAPSGRVDRFNLIPLLRDRADSGRTWQPVATSVRCAACQAVTRLRAGVAAARCDTCGATSLVVIDQTGAPVSAAGVVPFRLSEADAREAVRAWIAEHARMDFGRSRSAPVELRAVYVPWWDFFAHVHCPWRMELDRRNPDGNVERIVKTGTVDLHLEEGVPGVQTAPEALLAKAGPFDVASAHPFDARYLAGHTVEHYTLNLWDGWDAAHARMRAHLEKALRADARTWITVPDETWPSWTRESARLTLVPIFIGTYGSGSRVRPVVVNGATGAVAGDWVWSLAANLLGLAVLGGLAAVAGALVWGAWTLLKALGFRPLW